MNGGDTQIHATCIAIGDGADAPGVLLMGDSGTGKSDLALRLIDEGAKLVADDRVDLKVEAGRLTASAPKALAGRIEVRGVGIVPLAPANRAATAHVVVIVRLAPGAPVPRLPEAENEILVGVPVPLFRLDPFEVSATAKIRLLADAARRGILPLP